MLIHLLSYILLVTLFIILNMHNIVHGYLVTHNLKNQIMHATFFRRWTMVQF